jgi:hypothetical protein
VETLQIDYRIATESQRSLKHNSRTIISLMSAKEELTATGDRSSLCDLRCYITRISNGISLREFSRAEQKLREREREREAAAPDSSVEFRDRSQGSRKLVVTVSRDAEDTGEDTAD